MSISINLILNSAESSVLDGRGLIGYPIDIIHWTGYGSSFLRSNGYPGSNGYLLDNLQG
jgi:hypothetical protein